MKRYSYKKWEEIQRRKFYEVAARRPSEDIYRNEMYPDEIWYREEFVFNPQFFSEEEWNKLEVMALEKVFQTN